MTHSPFRAPLAHVAVALTAFTLTACPGFGEIDRGDEVAALTAVDHLKKKSAGGTGGDADTTQLISARGEPIEVNFVKPARPMLVVFSRLDCQRCRQEATSVSALAIQYRSRIDVLGVQLDLTAEEARRYAELRGNYPMAWDPSRDIARALRVDALPALVLLDTDGRVLLRQKWLSPTLRDRVEDLVSAQRKPAQPPAESTIY